MITPDYVRTMAAYNAEMNRRFYNAAGQLDDAQRRADGGLFWKSVHGTLSHLYWADRMWLSRFGFGAPAEAKLAESDRLVADFEDLWRKRQELDSGIIGWAAGLSQADLDGDLSWFSGAIGKTMVKKRALCLVQIFNHQAHHRGQVHALLTRAGLDTGATDLPFVL